MAISLEFVNLIIPIENIERVYAGGFKEYIKSERHRSTSMAWYDRHLYRIGKTDYWWLEAEIKFWKNLGLTPSVETDKGEKWKDLVVLQNGPIGLNVGFESDFILPGWIETNGVVAIRRGKFIGMIYPNDDLKSYNVPCIEGKEGEKALKVEKETNDVIIFREYGEFYETISGRKEEEVIQGLLDLGYTTEEKLHPLKPQTKWKKNGYKYFIKLNKFDTDYPDKFFVVFSRKHKKDNVKLNKANTKKLGLEKIKVVSKLIHYVQPYEIRLKGRYPIDDILED